eukprot:3547186-Prorocentrum_lima.AAC.1
MLCACRVFSSRRTCGLHPMSLRVHATCSTHVEEERISGRWAPPTRRAQPREGDRGKGAEEADCSVTI